METLGSGSVSTKQQRISQLAKRLSGVALTSLNHCIDMDWMYEAHRRIRKNAAVGVDGETAAEFSKNLKENLAELLSGCKSGIYRAPPVKRVHLPKGKNETRPIGMPTFADKVLQRAIAMVLEPIYEEEFLPFSFGFRPKCNPHQALAVLRANIMSMGGCWMIDADISKFFDTVDRSQMQQILRKRVQDGVITRMVGKWLHAGVMEDGMLYHEEAGTPQGGVISPLLSNIYLHEVLDTWFVQEVQPRLQGKSFAVRYADDFVMGFECRRDAERVMAVLPKRFARFGLAIHPQKTRLVDFRRPAPAQHGETFDFLGFTHYWGKARSNRRVMKSKTAKGKLSAALRKINLWCSKHRHLPLAEQQEVLMIKLRGHFQFYGITGNFRCLSRFVRWVERVWFKWLQRRSRKRDLTWEAFRRILRRFPLPKPRIMHSVYKDVQVKLPFEEPYAGNPLVRVCGGPGG
jgi:RNA-directed DNA polymerase